MLFIVCYSLPVFGEENPELGNSEVEKNLELGRIFVEEGEFLLAEHEFKKWLELDPSNYTFCKKVGNIYIIQGEYESAIVWYQKALDIKPDYSDSSVYNNLAECYKVKMEYDKAFKLINKAIEINPEKGLCYITLAEIYLKLGEEDKAFESLERAEKYIQNPYEKDTLYRVKNELLLE